MQTVICKVWTTIGAIFEKNYLIFEVKNSAIKVRNCDEILRIVSEHKKAQTFEK